MFDPRAYLAEYYSEVSGENAWLLRTLRAAWSGQACRDLLEFGGGPTVYQLIAAAPNVERITFAEYSGDNLAEVRRWQRAEAGAFDWTAFVACGLRAELGREVLSEEVALREELMRAKLVQFRPCDAFSADVVDGAPFDGVSVHFVPESISGDEAQFSAALDAVAAHVRPGGLLVMSALRRAEYWLVDGRRLPAFRLDLAELERRLGERSLQVEFAAEVDADAPARTDSGYEGYDGLITLRARRT